MDGVVARCPDCGTEQADEFPACFVCMTPSRWWCRECSSWLAARVCPACTAGLGVPAKLLLGTAPVDAVVAFVIPVRNVGRKLIDCSITLPDAGVALVNLPRIALASRSSIEIRGAVTVPPGPLGPRTFRIRFDAAVPAETLLVVDVVPAVPKLDFRPPVLALGSRVPGGIVRSTVTVKNTGNVPLKLKFTSSEPWLGFEPREVELTPEETHNLRVRVTSKKTDFGVREATVTATAAGARWTGTVQHTLPNPLLSSKPVSFGELKPGRAAFAELTIRNAGRGRVACALAPADSWLQVKPARVNLPAGKEKTLKLRALITTAHDGPQKSALIVTHETAGELFRIPVSAVGKVPKPVLRAVRKQTVRDAIGPPIERKFQVANDGDGRLELTATADQPWVKIVTSELKIAPGRKRKLRYVLDLPTLAQGEHTATITITSNGGTAKVPVSVKVLDPNPVLEVLPAPDLGLIMPDAPLSAFVQVRNAGVGLLTVQAMAEDGRVTLAPAVADVPTGPPVRFNLTVPVAHLSGGAHAVGVRFTSNGGEGRAELRFRLPVELFDVPALIDLGDRAAGRAAGDALRIKNTGPDRIALKLRGAEQWVHPATDRVAVAPGEMVSVPFRVELPAGTFGPVMGTLLVEGRSSSRSVSVRAVARKVDLVVVPGAVALGDLTPGAERAFAVDVVNQGEIVAEVPELHVRGELEVWVRRATVRPGERGTVTGRVRANTRQTGRELHTTIPLGDAATVRVAVNVVPPKLPRVLAGVAAAGGLLAGAGLSAAVGWWLGVPLALAGVATAAWLLWRETK